MKPIAINIEAPPDRLATSRRSEPVTVGIPLPRGYASASGAFRLRDPAGLVVPLQTRVLDRWPDGSARWLLLDFQATLLDMRRATYVMAAESATETAVPAVAVQVSDRDGLVSIDTGVARFEARPMGRFPFERVTLDKVDIVSADLTGLTLEDGAGAAWQPRVLRLVVEETGPVRAVVVWHGHVANERRQVQLEFEARLHFFAGSPTVRFVLTLRNPNRAGHPGNWWTLGDRGAVNLRDASLSFALPDCDAPTLAFCSLDRDQPFEAWKAPFEVYQESSGGPHWRSSNHVNRDGQVPLRVCGYRARSADGTERSGPRSTPVVSLRQGNRELAVCTRHFWENFPKAIEVSPRAIVLRLFPRQFDDGHEIQGGEQKTHDFSVAFGHDAVTDEPLAWCRTPVLARAEPSWYCASGAIPYLLPLDEDPNATYVDLVTRAVEGTDAFLEKREIIDEYGWRHFGDLYADHEAVFHRGPTPLVSHYNNQYDAMAGLGYQFLRTGDSRWQALMGELACHVIDIDIYHTNRDKSAFNGGLFWHTFHYVDAGRATHRSYPRVPGVPGGGPSNEHNYNSGLMLHHFLTGDPAAREAAIGLARWAVDMDDGSKTLFRWLSTGCTGLASSTAATDYHGPGRGAGNSIVALLNGYRLDGDRSFLAKAEQLIRRSVHPDDDIAGRQLLDAERRWSYTVFLQALARYIDDKAERGELDGMYAYASQCLLRYARWMAIHEHPYLDTSDALEYPTETWAAQDIRKAEVFLAASMHAQGEERARFLERAAFFFHYATSTLHGMKTRSLARPLVLLLTNGFKFAYFQRFHETAAPPSAVPAGDFGAPERFVPQRRRAITRALALVAGTGLLALISGLIYLLS